MGARSAKEGAKMGSREPLRASKTPKSAFAKTLKNLQFFKVFGVQGCLRQPQKAQEGSQEAPKELQNLKKKDPKMDPEIIVFLTSFGAILGAILGPELAAKGDQKWDHFWNPQVRADKGSGSCDFAN